MIFWHISVYTYTSLYNDILAYQEILTFLEHVRSHPFFTCLSTFRVVHVIQLHVFTVLVPCFDVRNDFRVKRCLTLVWFVGDSCIIYVIRIYLRVNGVHHDFHIRWCRLTVTRRVSHVEQKLLTLPKHLSLSPVFSGFVLLDL